MGKECCSDVSSRLWGGALRDETKNGCEGDYPSPVSMLILNCESLCIVNCGKSKIERGGGGVLRTKG